jgi:hypothetical protein
MEIGGANLVTGQDATFASELLLACDAIKEELHAATLMRS